MKFIKKLTICLSLLLVVVVCPVLLTACGKDNPEGKQIGKAVGAAVEVLQNKAEENSGTITSGLEYQENIENVDWSDNIIYIDYMKAVAEASKYDYSGDIFKGTMSVAPEEYPTEKMNTSAIHSFKIDGNNVKVEMFFAVQGSQDSEYDCMNINYDFDKDELISFEWNSIITSFDGDTSDSYFQSLKYENGALKDLVDNGSEEYISLKNETQTNANTLKNAKNISKVYNFSQEYVTVYNKYNVEFKIQVAK